MHTAGHKSGKYWRRKMTKGQQIVEDLRTEGYSDDQIKDALCDGEYLATTDFLQPDVEEAYYIIQRQHNAE